MAAGDLPYQASATEAGRQAELEEARWAVADDAYCLAHLGRFTEAVERLEGGRTRALAEALARDRASLAEAKAEDRKAFEKARDRIKTLEAAARARHDRDIDSPPRAAQSFLELSADLALARTNLAEKIERIRAYVPAFMAEGPTHAQISEAASPARPLAYLLTTSQGSLALIVTAEGKPLGPDQALWLHGFTTDTLDRLLLQRDAAGEVSGGYLLGQVSGDTLALSQALKRTLPLLRDELLGHWPITYGRWASPTPRLSQWGICRCSLSPTWCPRPGWPRSARLRTGGFPRTTSWPPGRPCARGTTSAPASASPAGPGDAGTYIKPMLVQAAWGAVQVHGRLQARYRRLVRRFGGEKNPGAKKKAIIAIAHTLLKIAYQVLKTGQPYTDLGADFYTRRESPGQQHAYLKRRLQKLHPGCTVTVTITPPPGSPPPGTPAEAA